MISVSEHVTGPTISGWSAGRPFSAGFQGVIASMAARAVRTENLTAPVLFRIVDQHQPTLLLDEVDTYIYQSEELRGLLNAGHKRGACAYRCEGNTVRAFRAFGRGAGGGTAGAGGSAAQDVSDRARSAL